MASKDFVSKGAKTLVGAATRFLGLGNTWSVNQLLPPGCVVDYTDYFNHQPLLSNVSRQRLFFAELSMLAYTKDSAVYKDKLKSVSDAGSVISIDVPSKNSTSDTNLLAFTRGNEAFVTFRGTEPFSAIDWNTDRKYTLVPFRTPADSLKVHKGFYDAIVELLSYKNALTNILEKKDTIWISGHSLGGALALMLAAMLHEKKMTDASIKVFTYGAPQVGNDAFVKTFQDIKSIECHQTINDQDVVPRLARLCDHKYSDKPMGTLYVFDSLEDMRTLKPSDRIPELLSLCPALNEAIAQRVAGLPASRVFPVALELSQTLSTLTGSLLVNLNFVPPQLLPFIQHSPRLYVEACKNFVK